MKRFLLVLSFLFFAVTINAQKNNSQKKISQQEFIEVTFLKNGNIYVDGKKTNLKELGTELKVLKQKNGLIHYFQAPNVKKSSLKKNIELIKLFAKQKLVVKLFSDKNFTKEFIE
tara:strand:- start:6852 stop:7196 length:345 start_codon:yes stop_codon:yes gene_type:complete